jgi:carbonic anhydrase
LFVVKNVGNIIPLSSVTGSTNSTAAAIEFAVETLRVSDIVVCGHSQCGAMAALLGNLPNGNAMPHLREWLKLATPVREIIQSQYAHLSNDAVRIDTAGEENVLFGLENLHSYHCVQERLMDGSLRLHGWFFKIATAELFAYDPETKQFSPLLAEK